MLTLKLIFNCLVTTFWENFLPLFTEHRNPQRDPFESRNFSMLYLTLCALCILLFKQKFVKWNGTCFIFLSMT